MPYRPEPLLTTARLKLRKPRIDDAQAIFETYAQDPEVTRYVTWKPHESIAMTEEFLRDAVAAWEGDERFVWAITEIDDDAPIGGIDARVEGHRVEIGYVIARPYWGKGYATEATRAIVEHATASPEISRVWAMCIVDNSASSRVLEKCGMEKEGRLRRFIVFPNLGDEARDVYVYSVVT